MSLTNILTAEGSSFRLPFRGKFGFVAYFWNNFPLTNQW